MKHYEKIYLTKLFNNKMIVKIDNIYELNVFKDILKTCNIFTLNDYSIGYAKMVDGKILFFNDIDEINGSIVNTKVLEKVVNEIAVSRLKYCEKFLDLMWGA